MCRRVAPGFGVLFGPYKEELSMAKAAAAQTTVTLKHLAAALAASHEMAKKQSELILNDLVGLVVKHLKKGDRIRIGGLGILQVRKRAARMGRNPRPASRSRSRRARRSPSAPPKSSRKPSEVSSDRAQPGLSGAFRAALPLSSPENDVRCFSRGRMRWRSGIASLQKNGSSSA
jgi:DNA-binding protein HU-beta